MNSAPHSLSWSEDLEAIVARRCAEEGMMRSEYVRKCIREEAQRHRERAMAQIASTMPEEFAAAHGMSRDPHAEKGG